MGVSQPWTAAPSAAEHARSVLAAAWSCAVTAEGGREEFVGAHTVTEDGRVTLDVPEDSTLVAAAICAPRGEPSAVLEFADVAPVPVRSRIRARLWIAGWFVPADGKLDFKATRVVLRRPSGAVVVDLDEFAAAAPDPLATAEARLLTHLADCHPDAVERLTRLVDSDSLHGDVRLPFHAPADDVARLTERRRCAAGSHRAPARCRAAAAGRRPPPPRNG